MLGQIAEAERLAREAVSLLEGTDVLAVRADALLDLADVLVVSGRSAAAGPVAAQARELYERKGHLVGVDVAERLLASL